MPEIIKRPAFVDRIPVAPWAHRIDQDQFEELANEYGLRIIGQGAYSSVIELDDKKVLAINRSGSYFDNPVRARIDFYNQKLLRILRPDFLPQFYAAYSGYVDDKGRVTPGGTIRERIYPDYEVEHEYITRRIEEDEEDIFTDDNSPVVTYGKYTDLPADYPGFAWKKFVPKEIYEAFCEWWNNGIKLHLDHGKPEHFVFTSDGKPKYLDVPTKMSSQFDTFDESKIYPFMDSKGYSEDDKKEVKNTISKIRHLYKLLEISNRLSGSSSHQSKSIQEMVADILGNFERPRIEVDYLTDADYSLLSCRLNNARYIAANS